MNKLFPIVLVLLCFGFAEEKDSLINSSFENLFRGEDTNSFLKIAHSYNNKLFVALFVDYDFDDEQYNNEYDYSFDALSNWVISFEVVDKKASPLFKGGRLPLVYRGNAIEYAIRNSVESWMPEDRYSLLNFLNVYKIALKDDTSKNYHFNDAFLVFRLGGGVLFKSKDFLLLNLLPSMENYNKLYINFSFNCALEIPFYSNNKIEIGSTFNRAVSSNEFWRLCFLSNNFNDEVFFKSIQWNYVSVLIPL